MHCVKSVHYQLTYFFLLQPGAWSDPLEVVSGAGVPDPPKQPQCVPRSAHSVVITWEGPVNNGATITDYRLEWQQKAEQDFSQVPKLVQKFTLFLLIWGCRTNWMLKTVMQMWLAGQVDSSQFESFKFFSI